MNNSGPYTGKLRVRVCGLLVHQKALLLVKVHSPVINEEVWLPPGGGVEFGEPLVKALEREFLEETGLIVKVGELVYINELLQEPYHAIEFYFLVEQESGILSLGADPEFDEEHQILKEIAFFRKEQMQLLEVAPSYLKEEFWQRLNSGRNDYPQFCS